MLSACIKTGFSVSLEKEGKKKQEKHYTGIVLYCMVACKKIKKRNGPKVIFM